MQQFGNKQNFKFYWAAQESMARWIDQSQYAY